MNRDELARQSEPVRSLALDVLDRWEREGVDPHAAIEEMADAVGVSDDVKADLHWLFGGAR